MHAPNANKESIVNFYCDCCVLPLLYFNFFLFRSVWNCRQKQKHYALLKTREKILGKQRRETKNKKSKRVTKTIPSYLLFNLFVYFVTIVFDRREWNPDHRAEIYTHMSTHTPAQQHLVLLQLSASGVFFVSLILSSPRNFRKWTDRSVNFSFVYLFTSEVLTANSVY